MNRPLICLYYAPYSYFQVHCDVRYTAKNARAFIGNSFRWTSGTKWSIFGWFHIDTHCFHARTTIDQRISQFISFFNDLINYLFSSIFRYVCVNIKYCVQNWFPIFLNQRLNWLKLKKNTFYNGRSEDIETSTTAEDTEYALTIRRRVIQFIQKWVIAVRQAVFEDPLTVAFIEVRLP